MLDCFIKYLVIFQGCWNLRNKYPCTCSHVVNYWGHFDIMLRTPVLQRDRRTWQLRFSVISVSVCWQCYFIHQHEVGSLFTVHRSLFNLLVPWLISFAERQTESCSPFAVHRSLFTERQTESCSPFSVHRSLFTEWRTESCSPFAVRYWLNGEQKAVHRLLFTVHYSLNGEQKAVHRSLFTVCYSLSSEQKAVYRSLFSE